MSTNSPLLHGLYSILRNKVNSKNYLKRSRTEPKAFTRDRVLTFSAMIGYIIWCANTSIATTLPAFLSKAFSDNRICTKQAFSKRRKLIRHEAIQELFEDSVEHLKTSFSTEDGIMPVFAIDGTHCDLPTHKELRKAYGVQESSGGQIQALLSLLYSPYNKVVMDVQVAPHDGNERALAAAHIRRIRQIMSTGPMLILFDRGYPSGPLMQLLAENDIHYLMRCTPEFVKNIKIDSEDVHVTHQFHSIRHPLTFRIVQVTLDNGTKEFLCTDLPDSYDAKRLKELYHDRWKIETNYNFTKNYVQLENLNGITKNAFLQEVYACMLLENLCAAYYIDQRVAEIPRAGQPGSVPKRKGKERIRDRRINMNRVLSLVRSVLPQVICKLRLDLESMLESFLWSRVNNIFTYIADSRDKPRKRIHPGAKFTQSQRPCY